MMACEPGDHELEQLLIQDTPWIDVRAPVEFQQGAIPGAVNLPILDDQQRAEVGTLYKQQGQDAAIALGHKLVSGSLKQTRIQAWADFARRYPQALLYCSRGGLRSKTAQQWLRQEHGVAIVRVAGGYKRIRRFLLQRLQQIAQTQAMFIIGGKTGTAKTALLQSFDQAIDLEALAHHRGSSFGYRAKQQPTQIDFENQLALALMKHQQQRYSHLLLEDEGRLIGRRVIPDALYQPMQQMPLIVLEADMEQRVAVSLNDYIIANYREFEQLYGAQARDYFSQYLLDSLRRIRKRLGGVLYQQLQQLMQTALRQQFEQGMLEAHREWIQIIMQQYYDPMYAYQLQKKHYRMVFAGNQTEVREYITQQMMHSDIAVIKQSTNHIG